MPAAVQPCACGSRRSLCMRETLSLQEVGLTALVDHGEVEGRTAQGTGLLSKVVIKGSLHSNKTAVFWFLF